MDVRIGLSRKLSRLLRVPYCKEIQEVHPKGDQSWVFIGRTDVEAETTILWPPDAKSWLIWKALMLGRIEGWGEGDNRGWDGWMASLTQWTWVWVDSGSWWWTGRPGVLQFMGLQRAGHDWATELNGTEPTPVSCLGKSMHRRVWWATVHGVPRVGHNWDTHILVVWPLFIASITTCVFPYLLHVYCQH